MVRASWAPPSPPPMASSSSGRPTPVDSGLAIGRLEVFHNGLWGSVCAAASGGSSRGGSVVQWRDSDAQVACRQLGYSHGYALTQQQPGALYPVSDGLTTPIWMSNLGCRWVRVSKLVLVGWLVSRWPHTCSKFVYLSSTFQLTSSQYKPMCEH